jgi:hypothetical protein
VPAYCGLRQPDLVQAEQWHRNDVLVVPLCTSSSSESIASQESYVRDRPSNCDMIENNKTHCPHSFHRLLIDQRVA